MAQTSKEQILKMFRDFGLGTDEDRARLLALATLAEPEFPVYNFIKLDDTTEGHLKGDHEGKLA